MDEAVDRVMEMKYGADGSAYGNAEVWSAPTATRPTPRRTPTRAPIGPRQVEYVKDACNYLYETYGRFPAHVDAFYAPGMWLQFSHLEMEYYDRFFDPSSTARPPTTASGTLSAGRGRRASACADHRNGTSPSHRVS
jgi:hypothetical protein